jgi:hypothetical protein
VKKGLFLVMIIGLTLALGAPAMAIDWSATGFIRMGTAYYKNIRHEWGVPLPVWDDWNDENAWVQTRARLQLTARASEDLYGVFFFEMDSRQWGEAGAGGNSIGAWGTDQVAVEVKHVYIDFRVPPKLPVWLRVGIQRITLRDKVFMARDGAGVTARIKIDPIGLSINPMWFKTFEGNVWRADDRDIYAVDANLPVGPVKLGTYFLWQENREWPTIADDGHLWWIGAYSDGKIGPVNYNFDFVYNDGTINFAAAPDVDFGGWLMRVVASYTWNNLNVGAGGWYSSGDDVSSTDYEGFALPLGRSETPASNDDILILMGDWFGTGGMTTGPSFVGSTGQYGGLSAPLTGAQFGGFWYVRAFANYQLFKWLKIGAQIAYIGDTTEDGDTFGTARVAPFGATNLEDNDEIGWEFDIGASIKIYKNLTYNLAFGYLIAGNALDQWDGVLSNTSPTDPWAFITRLEYKF